MAEEGMSSLHSWLYKPRTTVRIDTAVPWTAWLNALRRPFGGKAASSRIRIETLDRLSLGGKKSLVLIAIEGRRLLIGVGEDGAPSISALDSVGRPARPRTASRSARAIQRRKLAR
jgi:flagellar biogenesis protein FliO